MDQKLPADELVCIFHQTSLSIEINPTRQRMPSRLPPLPSVVDELGLGSPWFRLRRSCVRTLLAEVLPGMPSDASLEDVVQRVRDCGKAQDIIDCSIADGDGYNFAYSEEAEGFLIQIFPPDRDMDYDDPRIVWRTKQYLPRAADALDASASATSCLALSEYDGRMLACELLTLMHMSVDDGGRHAFRDLNANLGRLLAHASDACAMVNAMANCISRLHMPEWARALLADEYDILRAGLFSGGDNEDFEGSEDIDGWNDEDGWEFQMAVRGYRKGPMYENAHLARLARLTIQYMRSVRRWDCIGELLDWISKKVSKEEKLSATFSFFAATKGCPYNRNECIWHIDRVSKYQRLAWHVAAVCWRAHRRWVLQQYFLDWLEQSDVYKPFVNEHGMTRAPKRALEEFESMDWGEGEQEEGEVE